SGGMPAVPTPEEPDPGRVGGIRTRTARPRTLVLAVVLLLLQAVGFAALAVGVLVTTAGDERVASLPVLAFALLAAVAVAAVGRSLWRRRRWARGAAVAWSLLLVLTGLSQLSVNAPVAVGLAVLGLATAAAAVAPATRLALGSGEDDQPHG
uniref:hypothetical protein n=1 Tax=Miniimonas arenae TaxID=676201 RepID=UPI0028AC2C5E